jgi:hypothetical protein
MSLGMDPLKLSILPQHVGLSKCTTILPRTCWWEMRDALYKPTPSGTRCEGPMNTKVCLLMLLSHPSGCAGRKISFTGVASATVHVCYVSQVERHKALSASQSSLHPRLCPAFLRTARCSCLSSSSSLFHSSLGNLHHHWLLTECASIYCGHLVQTLTLSFPIPVAFGVKESLTLRSHSPIP